MNEPSEPFPMDELVAHLDGEHRIEDDRTSLRLIQAATVAELMRAIVRRPEDIADAHLICRRVAVYAFRSGILGDVTQEELGMMLGYRKQSAKGAFHALLRREERARNLPSAGPGRNANRGRRKKARR